MVLISGANEFATISFLPERGDGDADPLGVALLELAHLGGHLDPEVDLVGVLTHDLWMMHNKDISITTTLESEVGENTKRARFRLAHLQLDVLGLVLVLRHGGGSGGVEWLMDLRMANGNAFCFVSFLG